MKIANLFHGTITRSRYFLTGLGLSVAKFFIDWAVIYFVFHKDAQNYFDSIDSYYFLGDTFSSLESLMFQQGELTINLTLLAITLPFMLIGIGLTLKRLNALSIHPWLLILFFVPYLQLFFFAFLSVIPSMGARSGKTKTLKGDWLSQYLPKKPILAAAVSIAITSAFGALIIFFSTHFLRVYGGYLFVGLPFCLGFLTTLLYSPDHEVSFREDMGVGGLSVFFVAIVIFLFFMEGVICILMMLPLALLLSMIGVLCARAVRHSFDSYKGGQLLLLALLLPSLMGFETIGLKPTEWQVTSSVIVKASPEKVWKKVVAFSEIPVPQEFIFKFGIAYPTHATIVGRGVGAVRRCHFNTGDFLEPITQWDEPKLLAFGVESEAEPMTELTFYHNLRPPHLDGYFVSKKGQFRLTQLSDGSTLLEGTTWYSHAMWPETYWHLWSDGIVHQIHMRVLNHIKKVAEES